MARGKYVYSTSFLNQCVRKSLDISAAAFYFELISFLHLMIRLPATRSLRQLDVMASYLFHFQNMCSVSVKATMVIYMERESRKSQRSSYTQIPAITYVMGIKFFRGPHRYPFVKLPFIVVGLIASCFTWAPSRPPASLSTVPPLPNGNSCNTMALVLSFRPVRCGCRDTVSMKSESLIQKTGFRAKNFGRVSSSRVNTSVAVRRARATS